MNDVILFVKINVMITSQYENLTYH